MRSLLALALFLLPEQPGPQSGFLTGNGALPAAEQGSWLDLISGNEISRTGLIDDLAACDVIYLAETHTVDLHHSVHEKIISGLCEKGAAPVLVMEQLERETQDALDEYNKGSLSFEEFALKTEWKETWSNYCDYKNIMESTRTCGGTVLAANAPSAVISKVSRSGLVSLDAHERAALPETVDFNSPAYEKLLEKIFMVHAFMKPERKRFMFEAQVCRDEAIAETVYKGLGRARSAEKAGPVVVITGEYHVKFGLGVPARVERRAGPVRSRIVLVSRGNGPVLSRAEKAMSRPVTITHDDLKSAGLPPADYLYFVKIK
ncbi:MAG TPA: ChaN family lipoprotein [Spirochaetota bacterium]|nr:ChaN family lipoprotein [Spirochaetota bacterium]HPI89822.1 ChaN family lipoprotein [Spirochaetota bacterium]HPR49392.1 ChaN family lipoprotein [Spirochaetota bacterium]